jgi:arsenite methyltransferase
MEYKDINIRYSNLAEESCCLSCGGAINYSNAINGETCVDLGSGRGTDAIRLAELVGETGFVYGIDISDGMIQKAEATAAKMGIKNIRFIQTQLESIPIPDRTVDLGISNCTINHASDKQTVWNEVYRILKRGGRFIVSDIFATSPVPAEFKNDTKAIAECWAGAVTSKEYMEQLQKAGFVDVIIIEESRPYLKGKIEVSSFTIKGKVKNCCCH